MIYLCFAVLWPYYQYGCAYLNIIRVCLESRFCLHSKLQSPKLCCAECWTNGLSRGPRTLLSYWAGQLQLRDSPPPTGLNTSIIGDLAVIWGPYSAGIPESTLTLCFTTCWIICCISTTCGGANNPVLDSWMYRLDLGKREIQSLRWVSTDWTAFKCAPARG